VTTANPEQILRELDGLWASLGRDQNGSGMGVLRACSMTFLVVAEGPEETDPVAETLASLMREHPSRAIVLRWAEEESGRLESRVLAQCWMPFGRRQQICCERIEITAGPGERAAVPPLLRALIAPDLPVVLWCRDPGLLESPAMIDILDLAGKVIVDSEQAADPPAAVASIRRARALGRLVADLAWTRLTRGRESVAQYFADPRNAAKLDAIRRVVVECAEPPSDYLRLWLVRCLPGVALEFGRLTEPPSDDTLRLVVDGSRPADAELLREELSILGRDRVYEEVLGA
jgi:glucose-6-phosphate dehydrogenase assembly protein OpcA